MLSQRVRDVSATAREAMRRSADRRLAATSGHGRSTLTDPSVALNGPQRLAKCSLLPGNTVAMPWGRGIGKSFFERLVWYSAISQWDGVRREGAPRPGVRIVLLMPTFKACKDIHGKLVEQDLTGGGDWAWLKAKINHTEWQITFPGGSWIQFFGAREANSARGLRCDIVTVDEADDIEPSVLDSVVKPWFSEAWSLRQLLLGGTPRRGRYGLLYREHKAGIDGDGARATDLATIADEAERAKVVAMSRRFSFHATYKDAPETVDPAFAEEVKASTPPAVFSREWECSFESGEGLVYSMFDERFHVRELAHGTSLSEVIVGVDHGWEDPGVFLVIAVVGHGRDATCYVIEEVYEQHRVESWWVAEARKIKARYPTAKWYADPSQPARIKALKDGAQIHIENGRNTPIEDGVSAVADRLAIRRVDVGTKDKPDEKAFARLYVSRRCPNTIIEFGKYRRKRDPRDADKFLDDIEDKNNHSMDCGRYALHTRFGGGDRSVTTSGAGWT